MSGEKVQPEETFRGRKGVMALLTVIMLVLAGVSLVLIMRRPVSWEAPAVQQEMLRYNVTEADFALAPPAPPPSAPQEMDGLADLLDQVDLTSVPDEKKLPLRQAVTALLKRCPALLDVAVDQNRGIVVKNDAPSPVVQWVQQRVVKSYRRTYSLVVSFRKNSLQYVPVSLTRNYGPYDQTPSVTFDFAGGNLGGNLGGSDQSGAPLGVWVRDEEALRWFCPEAPKPPEEPGPPGAVSPSSPYRFIPLEGDAASGTDFENSPGSFSL